MTNWSQVVRWETNMTLLQKVVQLGQLHSNKGGPQFDLLGPLPSVIGIAAVAPFLYQLHHHKRVRGWNGQVNLMIVSKFKRQLVG